MAKYNGDRCQDVKYSAEFDAVAAVLADAAASAFASPERVTTAYTCNIDMLTEQLNARQTHDKWMTQGKRTEQSHAVF